VETLDVLAPRLSIAGGNRALLQIQFSWDRINKSGRVRVLTLDAQDCLQGGVDLPEGIEVRIAQRDLGSEGFSYHIFGGPSRASHTVIVNHHTDSADRPERLRGPEAAHLFRNHFEAAWDAAKPLESVLADRILAKAGRSPDRAAVMKALAEVHADLNLKPGLYQRVLMHLALRHGCPVILVVGLPGSGKSLVRQRLAAKLRTAGVTTRELSDYVYAYRDHLHASLKMQPARGVGFEAELGGAFSVRDENTLAPALNALAHATFESVNEYEVTVVEFARTDLLGSLQAFAELRSPIQVVHVEASPPRRAQRLSSRAEPPQITVEEGSLRVALSDNHALPSVVNKELYGVDDVEELMRSAQWRDRIFKIDNDLDDGGARIAERLQAFMDGTVAAYRAIESR
jgi:hypothetical protein